MFFIFRTDVQAKKDLVAMLLEFLNYIDAVGSTPRDVPSDSSDDNEKAFDQFLEEFIASRGNK